MAIRKTLKDYIVGLQHIGHIVADLDEAIASFVALYGIDERNIRREPKTPGPEVATLFAFVSIGRTEFELIQPVAPEFRDILLKSPSGGGGINHVAWRVSDIEACVRLLADQGIRPGHVTPDGIVTFRSRKLVYLDPVDTRGLLIELIEISE